jgi:hypothetical protein
MGSAKEAPERDVYETGAEPEFIIHDLWKWEDAGDGLMRVFCVSRRGRADKNEYSVVCTPERLAYMCRKGLMFASEAHNLLIFKEALTEH